MRKVSCSEEYASIMELTRRNKSDFQVHKNVPFGLNTYGPNGLPFSSVHFSPVTQSCLTLCKPMNWSMPGFPVHHQPPEFTQTHLHWVGDPTISSSVITFASHIQSFPASGSFQMSQFFTAGGQSIGVSPSASVLPMNVQDWFPLGWTGWISLLSKGL